MNKEEILYNQLYEKTKDFGRVHFIKEIMKLNKDLQQQSRIKKDCDQYKQALNEIREYINEFIFEPLLVSEDRKLIICNQNLRKLEQIIEKGLGENNDN